MLRRLTFEGCALHLVTHRSLWSDEKDKHRAIRRRERLEKALLGPFGFSSFIHGHNHNFVSRMTTTPKRGLSIRRLGVPTLSERSGERGYVRWCASVGLEPELKLIRL